MVPRGDGAGVRGGLGVKGGLGVRVGSCGCQWVKVKMPARLGGKGVVGHEVGSFPVDVGLGWVVVSVEWEKVPVWGYMRKELV